MILSAAHEQGNLKKLGYCFIWANTPWVYKMLTSGQAGWQVYRNPLYYLGNFSVNLELLQNEIILKKRKPSGNTCARTMKRQMMYTGKYLLYVFSRLIYLLCRQHFENSTRKCLLEDRHKNRQVCLSHIHMTKYYFKCSAS